VCSLVKDNIQIYYVSYKAVNKLHCIM